MIFLSSRYNSRMDPVVSPLQPNPRASQFHPQLLEGLPRCRSAASRAGGLFAMRVLYQLGVRS